jgi:hypothetical protein
MSSYGQDDNLKGIYSAINKTIYPLLLLLHVGLML